MKRFPLWILPAFLLLITGAGTSYGAEMAPAGTMARKAQRGFLNVALCTFEISHEVVQSQPYDTALPTWIAGLIKGSFKAVSRALVGGYEMVTFPLPLPSHYDPVLQPELPWDLLEARKKAKNLKTSSTEAGV
jgi:putative exosortase-associated protein (TIGR04073 family)